MTTVTLKALTDDTATVAGWGVVFGGRDLDGEAFAKDTDFMLGLVPTKPVLYDHAQRDVKHWIGTVTKAEVSDEGIWVEAELDRHAGYVEQVLKLVEKGALGWSSGSVGHLTRREGGIIKAWPVVEWSLTPTPAEPRTLGVDVIKSLMETDPSFGALLPEAEAATSAAGAEDVQDSTTEPVAPVQEDNMTEDVKAVEQMDVAAELKTLRDELAALKAAPPVNAQPVHAPNVNTRTKPGDDETKATAYYIRTGDASAIKASNNNDMTIADNTYAGYAVPTGHYNGIIAKRDATWLVPKLGVMRIPGRGTTTNVPYDNGTANVFVSTAEATNFDRDAPIIGQKAFTLVKYTKKIQLTYELLEDEDSRLMEFVNDYVGRALALTHNNLLITEALAAGTSTALGAVTAVSVGDPQTLVYTLKQEYADNAQFIMASATYAAFMKLVGSDFQFAQTPGGSRNMELWGFPVQRDANLEAIGSGKKTILFGNFGYMGLYEAPSLTFLRNPYDAADTGHVNLYYYFRADYGVLLPEAILYGQHPTA